MPWLIGVQLSKHVYRCTIRLFTHSCCGLANFPFFLDTCLTPILANFISKYFAPIHIQTNFVVVLSVHFA